MSRPPLPPRPTTVQIGVRLPLRLLTRLDAKARAMGAHRSAAVIALLTQALDSEGKGVGRG